MIKHSYETLSVQIDLLDPVVFGSSMGLDLLRVAHENGGFIAGGFARKIVMLSQNSMLSMTKKLRHLNTYLMSRGDVDVFFFDHMGYEKTLQWALDNATGTPQILINDSLTGNAKNITIDDVKFQLINIVVGKPEQVISTFDICNAMVVIRADQAIQLVGRSDLDANGLLKVCNWSSPYTVCRVAKYLERMNDERRRSDAIYETTASAMLHSQTAGELIDVAHALIIKLKNEPISYRNNNKIKFTENNVIGSLKYLVPWLPSDHLVLLAAFFAQEKKNIVIEELIKRGQVPKLLVANWSLY